MKRIVPTTYRQARDLADASRDKAYAVIDEHRLRESAHRSYWRAKERQYWWQLWKPRTHMPLSIPFDTAVDRRVNTDPRWAQHVSDNQWYIQYATMYAQGEQLTELERLRKCIDIAQAVSTSPTLRRIMGQRAA